MLIAVGKRDGRKLLVIGLESENIKRLLDDMPILRRLDEVDGMVELDGWDIAVLGPEDTVRFVQQAGDAFPKLERRGE